MEGGNDGSSRTDTSLAADRRNARKGSAVDAAVESAGTALLEIARNVDALEREGVALRRRRILVVDGASCVASRAERALVLVD